MAFFTWQTAGTMPDTEKTHPRSSLASFYILLFIAMAWIVLEFARIPGRTRLLQEIPNAGHVVLFGILAVACASVLNRLPRYRTLVLRRYIVSFLIAIAVGAAGELAQYFGPRNASVIDFARDAVGAFSFLVFDAWFRAMRDGRSNKAYLAMVAAAVISLGVVMWPIGQIVAAKFFQLRAFPTLMAPDQYWSRIYLDPVNTRIRRVATHDDFSLNSVTKNSIQVRLSGNGWSGFAIADMPADWRAYSYLEFPLYARDPAESPVMRIRLYDRFDGWERREWTTIDVAIAEVQQVISVPVANLEIDGGIRPLDRDSVLRVYFYFPGSAAGAELQVGNITLR